jgi:hypothetical protein
MPLARRTPLHDAAILVVAISTTAWSGPPPRIADLVPAGVPRGVPTVVTFRGVKPNDAHPRVIAPASVRVEPASAAGADAFAATITVPADVPIGVLPIRVQTDDGLSDAMLLDVGPLPQAVEVEPNNAFETAPAVPGPLPLVIEGRLEGTDVDFFRFSGRKGEVVAIDARCARIGSSADPQLRLTMASRRYVAAIDDVPGLGPDARLVVALPEDGDYVVELSDTRYAGGDRPVYRLLIGSMPLATERFPLGGRVGETVGFEFRGGTVTGTAITAITLGEPGPGPDILAPHAPDLSNWPELRGPSESMADTVVRAAPPVVLNGRLDVKGQVDRFTLVGLGPGSRWRASVRAASLGSALDASLQLTGPDGGVLGTADDTQARPDDARSPFLAPGAISPDPTLTFTVPDGSRELTLALRDIARGGGVGYPYRIVVEPAAPRVEPVLLAGHQTIPRGGTAHVAVALNREGFDGTIRLDAAEALPEGLSVRPGLVPDGPKTGTLSISAAPEAAFDAVKLNVIITPEGQPKRGASLPPPSRAALTLALTIRDNLPITTSYQEGVYVATGAPGPIAIDAPVEPVRIARGASGVVPLTIRRDKDTKAGLKFGGDKPLKGVEMPAFEVPADAATFDLTVKIGADAPIGKMTVAPALTWKQGKNDRGVAVPVVTIEVVEPEPAPKPEARP